MRSNSHIRTKHTKQGHLVKTCLFTVLKTIIHNQASPTNQPNMLTISTSNTYPNILETMIYYNPNIKE